MGNETAYRYDPLGNRNSQTRVSKDSKPDQTTRYEYVAAGQLVQMTDPVGGKRPFAYDKEGRLVTEEQKDGSRTRYQYDKAGWLKKRVESGTGPKETYEYEYDKNGNRTKETKTAAGGSAQRETIQYTYDGLNQLTGVTD